MPAEPEDTKARLTVFSDYVCPFFYLEEPDLARIRQEYGEEAEIDYRAYELRPYPAPTLEPDGEYLHRVWEAVVYPMAESLGMNLSLPPAQPRSRRALETAEYARESGRFPQTHEALFRAFFVDGRDLDDTGVLLDVGAQTGLDREDLRRALDEGRHTGKVAADEALAKRLGVLSVPTILVGHPDLPLEKSEAVVGTQTGNRRLQEAVERVLYNENRA